MSVREKNQSASGKPGWPPMEVQSTLKTPLELAVHSVGRLMLCGRSESDNRGVVLELDASRLTASSTTWSKGNLSNPRGCQGLPDGRRLVALYNDQKVVEFDDAKNVVAQISVPGNPHSVQRLSNGGTLVSLSRQHKVVELNRAGAVVWSHDFPSQIPVDARRLPNGNTIITLEKAGSVVELDKNRKLVWKVERIEPSDSRPAIGER